MQFRDALAGLQVSIAAGYSIENAIKEARKDLEKIYGKKGEMTAEFYHIETQLEHGVSIEKLLAELGSGLHTTSMQESGHSHPGKFQTLHQSVHRKPF